MLRAVPETTRNAASSQVAFISFALSLTISKTIPLSLDATDNQALIKLAPAIVQAVRKEGMDLADAFAAHSVFPEEFLHVLRTAETAGSIPEEMGRLSEHYNEQSRLQMAMLNQAAGWVWPGSGGSGTGQRAPRRRWPGRAPVSSPWSNVTSPDLMVAT